MKIGLLTVSHKRPHIDKCYCLMVDRLRNDYPDLFLPLAAVSIKEEMKTFEDHGIETYLYKNEPVSDKHNFIFSQAKGRCTHAMYVGSDDIIDKKYMDELLKHAQRDMVWGVGLCFYSTRLKEARYWDMPFRRVAGPARMMRAELLDKVDWRIFVDGFNNLLDHKSWDIVSPHIKTKYQFRVGEIKGLLMDIKSDINMNGYDQFRRQGREMNLDYIYRRLSKIEWEYLQSLN